MSALRQLKRSIRERETGRRGTDKPKREGVKGTGRRHRLGQRAAKAGRKRARLEGAKASRRRNRDGK